MTKTVVRVERWSSPRPPAPNGSTVGGTDYYEATYERETWPQDGSAFAGRTYETKWVRIGPEEGFYPVIVGHSNYPAPAEPAGDHEACQGAEFDFETGKGFCPGHLAPLVPGGTLRELWGRDD